MPILAALRRSELGPSARCLAAPPYSVGSGDGSGWPPPMVLFKQQQQISRHHSSFLSNRDCCAHHSALPSFQLLGRLKEEWARGTLHKGPSGSSLSRTGPPVGQDGIFKVFGIKSSSAAVKLQWRDTSAQRCLGNTFAVVKCAQRGRGGKAQKVVEQSL